MRILTLALVVLACNATADPCQTCKDVVGMVKHLQRWKISESNCARIIKSLCVCPELDSDTCQQLEEDMTCVYKACSSDPSKCVHNVCEQYCH